MTIDFARNARVYDDRHGVLLDGALAERLMAGAGVEPGARLLDVGAGTGRVAVALAALGHRVVAVDRAAAMLAQLRGKSFTHSNLSIHPAIADALALPFADASFAIIAAARLMYLLPTWRTAIAEIARVLRPRGHLLHEWGNGEADEPWVQVRDKARELFEAAGVANPFHPGARSEDQVDRQLRAHGFAVAATVRADFGAETTIARFLDQIETGELSYTWNVPVDVQRAWLPRLRQWAAERFDPQLPFAAPRTVTWTVYRKA